MTTNRIGYDERVLICAPVGRDAALIRQALGKAGIGAEISPDLGQVCREIAVGAAALCLTQEALSPAAVEQLLDALGEQPSWSDLPIVVLVSRGPSTSTTSTLAVQLATRANVTFLERPVSVSTLVSATRAALRTRRRQYEFRDLLAARLQAEDAERQARAEVEQAIRGRDQFMASVAHDLKNPLGAIKGYAQLLQRKAARSSTDGAAGLLPGLAKIDSMATRTVAQIDELLDLARLRANQSLPLNTAPTDLVPLVRTVVEEYQQATARHTIRVETPVDEILGVWDSPRLERVIGNLISKAVKYSTPEHEIVVTLSVEEAPEGLAILSVRDRGIGIPAADLPHLFEPFYRANNAVGRKPGTGLGLAGARHIVEQHGGRIEVESQEGKGSTFTIRLPVVQAGPGRPLS